MEVPEACQRTGCDGDLLVEIASESSAKLTLTCEREDCPWSTATHWRNLFDLGNPTQRRLRLDRRFDRAEARDDEAMMDQIADEMLDVANREEMLNVLRGT